MKVRVKFGVSKLNRSRNIRLPQTRDERRRPTDPMAIGQNAFKTYQRSVKWLYHIRTMKMPLPPISRLLEQASDIVYAVEISPNLDTSVCRRGQVV